MSSWFWSSTVSAEESTEDSTDVTKLDPVLFTTEEINQPSFQNFVEELKQFGKDNLKSSSGAEISQDGIWKRTTEKKVNPKPFEVELAFHRKRILNLEENFNERKVETLEERVEVLEDELFTLNRTVSELTNLINNLESKLRVSNFQKRTFDNGI